jgi:hypothetical protein
MSPTKLQCPHCHAILKTASPLPAGRLVGCPKCHQKFSVNNAHEDPPEESIVEIDDEVEAARAPKPAHKLARKRQASQSKKILLSSIAGGVAALVLAIAVAVTVNYLKQRNAPAATGAVAGITNQGDQALPLWEPDAAVLGELGPEVDAAQYHLRVPRGYAQVPGFQMPLPVKAIIWRMPPRPDGSVATLMLAEEPGPPGGALTEALSRKVADQFLGGVRLTIQQVKEDEFARGRIHGFDSILIRWTGNASVPGRVVRGASYLTLIGQKLVTITASDFEPHHEATRRLGEAAALTLRK